MKCICFGYMDATKSEAMSESEMSAALAECFAYDSGLRQKGELIGGEVLQEPRSGKTLRHGGGKVSVADGPFAQSREQLTGILSLETTDIDHAVRLMSAHPSVRMGMIWELRPVADMTAIMADGEGQRTTGKSQREKSKRARR